MATQSDPGPGAVRGKRSLRRLSLKWKMLVFVMVATVSSALLSTAGGLYTEQLALRRDVGQEIAALARVTEQMVQAPLLFQDAESARKVLQALGLHPYLHSVLLLDREGRRVAAFEIQPGESGGPQAFMQSANTSGDRLVQKHPVHMSGEQIGSLVFTANIDGHARERMYGSLRSSFAVMVPVLLIVFLFSMRLQRLITVPMQRLTETTRRVVQSRDYSLRAARVTKGDEVADLVIGFNRMLDEIEQRDRDLRATRDELEARVAERTRELDDKRQLAEQASEAKSMFLANMSHEIRTPLNGIMGMLEVLYYSDIDGEQRELLRTVRESSNSLLHLINDILDFSKIEAGRMELETRPTDVRALVESVISLTAGLAHQKGLKVHLLIDPQLASRLQVDSVRLRQVLSNLLSNAIKFTSSGHVSIELRVYRDQGNTQQIRLSVMDTGIGVSPEKLEQLFQPFTQAESSTTRRFGGTGLGLVICRRLVELMGGSLQFESREGVGSILTLDVPLAVRAREDSQGELLRELGIRKAYILDDSGAERAILLTCLGALNVQPVLENIFPMQVSQVGSLAKSHGCDLIITRQHFLRHRYGIGADTMRNMARTWGHPVIVLSETPDLSSSLFDDDYVQISENPLQPSRLETGLLRIAGVDTLAETAQQHSELGQQPLPTREQAIADGRLVLVAEDHPTNQKVIRRQLALCGVQCDVYPDGEQALAAWRSGDYKLLLTDCHMPCMDGYELTRAIRSQERAGEHIPIIAVTANALAGEADNCRAAGMDDYLSKPFEVRTLQGKLSRFLGTREGKPAPENSQPPLADETPADSLAGAIDMELLVETFGDREMVVELLQEFLVTNGEDAERVEKMLEKRDAGELGHTAHRVKGAARLIGAAGLAGHALALEQAGRETDWQTINETMPLFRRSMQRVEAAIRSVIGQPGTPDGQERVSNV